MMELIAGSGSTYIFGYCDSNYKPGMTKEECLSFVRTGELTKAQTKHPFSLQST